MGALQTAAAVVAFVFAARGALRGATLAVAGSLMLGWLSSLPGALEQGIDFSGWRWGHAGPARPVAARPVAARRGRRCCAGVAWQLSHRWPRLLASSMTIVGLIVVIAFAVVIAVSGF
ncbi:MAG: hypothetical protein KL863_21185 [Rhizobium sp.]|nr:hypothetical protein [Rhizobium sp.]